MSRIIFFVFWILQTISVNCSYIVLKNNLLPNKTSGKYLDIGVLGNELLCARTCKNDINCEGSEYNIKEGWCGMINGNGFADISQRLPGTTFQVETRVERKCGQWHKLLTVDNSGGVISGNFSSLKSALLSGQNLQIVFEKADNTTRSFVINYASVNETVICGQSEILVYVTTSSIAELRFYFLCTNGRFQVGQIRMNFTENEHIFENIDFNKIDWFAFKDSCLQVMIRDTSKPYIIVDNMHVFYVSVMETQDSFVKINYKTYTDIIHTDEIVEMTSIGEIYSAFTGNDLEYADNFTWVTTKYNFSKIVEVFSCKTTENTLCGHSYNAVDQTIFVDGNWEKTFTHTSEGNTVFGSLQSLREKVSNGHRLLLHFRGKLREPDMVIFDEDNITAVFSLYPLKQSDSYQAIVLWEMVSTSGKYETVVFDFWTGSVLNETIGTSECSWFVDKATWTNVFDSESNTTEKLATAFKSGSRIRIKSNCLHSIENSTSFSCLYGAPTLFQSRGASSVVARANLYPSLTLRNTGLHFSIDAKPVWMLLRIRTPGIVTRQLWLHGQSYSESSLMIKTDDITWFAN